MSETYLGTAGKLTIAPNLVARGNGCVFDTHSLINTSGIHPLTRRVLVLRDAVEERTKGGIILPDSEVDKQKWATVNGTLIAAGPLAWAEDRHDAALYGVPHGIPEPGARVKVGKYTGDNHEGADGKLYTLMNDSDVLAELTSEAGK